MLTNTGEHLCGGKGSSRPTSVTGDPSAAVEVDEPRTQLCRALFTLCARTCSCRMWEESARRVDADGHAVEPGVLRLHSHIMHVHVEEFEMAHNSLSFLDR